MQSYVLPLADFTAVTASLDLGALTEVRFVFDRAVAGTVLIDDVGFAVMDEAYLADRY